MQQISFLDNNNNANFHKVACVGKNGFVSQKNYYDGYKKAVNILEEKFVYNPDTLVYVILYSIRHSIELGLKICLSNLQKVTPQTLLCKGHSLKELFMESKKNAVKIDPRFDTLFKNIETSVLEFDAVDPTAQVFRYREDVDGNPHLENASRLDVDLACKNARTVFKQIDEMIGLSQEIIVDFEYQKKYFSDSLDQTIPNYKFNLSFYYLNELVKILPGLSLLKNAEIKKRKITIKSSLKLSNKQIDESLKVIRSNDFFKLILDDSEYGKKRINALERIESLIEKFNLQYCAKVDPMGIDFLSDADTVYEKLNELSKLENILLPQIEKEEAVNVKFAFFVCYLAIHHNEFSSHFYWYDVYENPEKYIDDYKSYLIDRDTSERIKRGKEILGLRKF